jgi:hypothetical protein
VPPVKSKEEVTMILDEFKNQKVEMTFVDAKLTESQQQVNLAALLLLMSVLLCLLITD